MNEIKRLDSIITVNGFFYTYNATNSEHFVELFGALNDGDIASLDNLLSDIYGDLPLISRYASMESGAINRIVTNCDFLFYETWKHYKKAIAGGAVNDYNAPYIEKTQRNESRNNVTNATSATTDKNQVYAFDDVDNASNDNLSTSNGKNDVTDNRTVDRTDTVSKSGTLLPTDVAKSQIDFSKNEVFLELVFTDIIETVCACVT